MEKRTRMASACSLEICWVVRSLARSTSLADLAAWRRDGPAPSAPLTPRQRSSSAACFMAGNTLPTYAPPAVKSEFKLLWKLPDSCKSVAEPCTRQGQFHVEAWACMPGRHRHHLAGQSCCKWTGMEIMTKEGMHASWQTESSQAGRAGVLL